jgi:hypothetical protein
MSSRPIGFQAEVFMIDSCPPFINVDCLFFTSIHSIPRKMLNRRRRRRRRRSTTPILIIHSEQ